MEATWNTTNLENFSVFEKNVMVYYYLESTDVCLSKLQAEHRLRVVPLSLSPSCVMRKKTAREKKATRNPGGDFFSRFSFASRSTD